MSILSIRRALSASLAAAAVALCAGCASDDGGNTAPARRIGDAPGEELAGVARIASIDRATVNQDGKVRYFLDNTSGADQEDLTWSVSFLFPGRAGVGDGGISIDEQAETTAERSLVLLRGEQGKKLEAQCAALAEHHARGENVIGTRINVAQNLPVATMARSATQQGTRLAAGKIECVGQSDIESPTSPEELVLEFENVSGGKVSDLELQVVFTSSLARSKWRAIPSMGAGQRAKVVVDLRGLDIGDRSFLVKVRQQAL